MEPSLIPGRRILCRALDTPPSRGAIVVLPHPRRTQMWLVKRIVGLPGEEVVIDFGQVLIDGNPSVDIWSAGHDTFPEGKWSLGRGEVLVLSDNRPATADDGRSFGPVPTQGMFVVIWPPTRTGRPARHRNPP